jgi:hypothetical protein
MPGPERPVDPSEDYGKTKGWIALRTILRTFPVEEKLNADELARESVDFALDGEEPPRTDVNPEVAAKALAIEFKELFGRVFGVSFDEEQ